MEEKSEVVVEFRGWGQCFGGPPENQAEEDGEESVASKLNNDLYNQNEIERFECYVALVLLLPNIEEK